MVNKIGVKFEIDWGISMFTYKNYGFYTTREQQQKAFAQWLWCVQNVK